MIFFGLPQLIIHIGDVTLMLRKKISVKIQISEKARFYIITRKMIPR